MFSLCCNFIPISIPGITGIPEFCIKHENRDLGWRKIKPEATSAEQHFLLNFLILYKKSIIFPNKPLKLAIGSYILLGLEKKYEVYDIP